MNRLLKHNIKEIALIALAWIIITLFFLFIKFYDIPDSCLVDVYGSQFTISKKYIFIVSFGISIPLGIILGIFHTYVYPSLRRKKLYVVITLRVLVFCLLVLSYYSVFYVLVEDESIVLNAYPYHFFRKDTAQPIIVYALTLEFLATTFITLRRGLGENYLSRLVKNTYGNPKEEKRVFMFLDLEDSTPFAKKIGHLNYSKFIQDCFWDLSDVVLMYQAEIYQFVGDEAVITWKVNDDFDFLKCIDLYYTYASVLENKSKYYANNYNHIPKFRCAIHFGTVSTAVVGNYKREIAYHGDVLNLCSRIQSRCKSSASDVLISENFARLIKPTQTTYKLEKVILEGLEGVEQSQISYKVSLGSV